MSTPPDPPQKSGYRRLLVGFNHQIESRTALDLAAKLAEAVQTELVGVFVMDQDLLDMARLPFTTEILRASRQTRNLDPAAIELELRATAELMQRRLRQLALRAHRQCSFRTVHGHLLRALMAQAEAGDLILLRQTDLPWPGGRQTVLAMDGPVVLMTPAAAGRDGLENLARQIAQVLQKTFIAAPMDTPLAKLSELRPGLVIAPADMFESSDDKAVKRFTDAVRCPVLIAPV